MGADLTARTQSCPELSSLSKMQVAELAKLSQKAIREQLRLTADATKIDVLMALHDQLSSDLAVYYESAGTLAME